MTGLYIYLYYRIGITADKKRFRTKLQTKTQTKLTKRCSTYRKTPSDFYNLGTTIFKMCSRKNKKQNVKAHSSLKGQGVSIKYIVLQGFPLQQPVLRLVQRHFVSF